MPGGGDRWWWCDYAGGTLQVTNKGYGGGVNVMVVVSKKGGSAIINHPLLSPFSRPSLLW